jgi:orotidine-5'-phosphate decarboxylase
MTFQQKYENIIKKNKSFVCVGLDSDLEKISDKYKNTKFPQFEFNKQIISQTFDLVCAYKINSAFYEARGSKGIEELKMTFDFLIKNFPEIPIILDAKRGDIGNTNNGYADFAFEYLKADAITIHPYHGQEANQPFLNYKDKGIFILCKTSNSGSNEFQNLDCGKKKLYEIVAENVAKNWNQNNNCALVVGATYPEELGNIRKIVGDMILLIPGIGKQGGDLKKTLKAGINSQESGIIVNSSRDIIFSENPRGKTLSLKNDINNCICNIKE